MSGVGFLSSLYVLEETKQFEPTASPYHWIKKVTTSLTAWPSLVFSSKTKSATSTSPDAERQPLLASNSNQCFIDVDDKERGLSKKKKERMTVWQLLCDRKIFLNIVLYAYISALYIQYVNR